MIPNGYCKEAIYSNENLTFENSFPEQSSKKVSFRTNQSI